MTGGDLPLVVGYIIAWLVFPMGKQEPTQVPPRSKPEREAIRIELGLFLEG